MDHDKLVEYVRLLEPCVYYQEPSDNWRLVLAYFDCPKEWREPIRVVADGWSYYSADMWYAKYVDIDAKRDYMDEYWDQV